VIENSPGNEISAIPQKNAFSDSIDVAYARLRDAMGGGYPVGFQGLDPDVG